MTSGATESSASTITVLASTFASMLLTPGNSNSSSSSSHGSI
jgi:hypothetical protein